MMKLFRRFETRGDLLGAMIRRTGADLAGAGGLAAENSIRQAINRCLLCRAETECKAWLADAEPGANPPAFCPNAALLSALRPRSDRLAGEAKSATTGPVGRKEPSLGPALRRWTASIVGWWRELKLNWTAAQQLDRSAPQQVDRVLAEFVLTLKDLRHRSGRAPQSLLADLMERLGLDRKAAVDDSPVMLWEMERVCGLCEQRSRCRSDLQHGRIAGSAPAYCPNRTDLSALAGSRRFHLEANAAIAAAA